MQLPSYWDTESGVSYFTIGDGVSGTVEIEGQTVRYSFFDGNGWWVRERVFPSPKAALRFALLWGRHMRKCERRGTVPLPVVFDGF